MKRNPKTRGLKPLWTVAHTTEPHASLVKRNVVELEAMRGKAA